MDYLDLTCYVSMHVVYKYYQFTKTKRDLCGSYMPLTIFIPLGGFFWTATKFEPD